jgi:hypothetical protein
LKEPVFLSANLLYIEISPNNQQKSPALSSPKEQEIYHFIILLSTAQGFGTPLQPFSHKQNASIGGLDATSRCRIGCSVTLPCCHAATFLKPDSVAAKISCPFITERTGDLSFYYFAVHCTKASARRCSRSPTKKTLQ